MKDAGFRLWVHGRRSSKSNKTHERSTTGLLVRQFRGEFQQFFPFGA